MTQEQEFYQFFLTAGAVMFSPAICYMLFIGIKGLLIYFKNKPNDLSYRAEDYDKYSNK